MKDSDLRGLILQKLYDQRHAARPYVGVPQGLEIENIENRIIGNVTKDLADQGLIDFKRGSMSSTPSGLARINSRGIDVIEKTITAPIPITFDYSITVQGSQNVMFGGEGNIQNVTIDIERMISVVDSADATVTEKEEAKSLLKKISENKLVQMALGSLLKKYGGTGG